MVPHGNHFLISLLKPLFWYLPIKYAIFKNNYCQYTIVSFNEDMIFQRYEKISLSNESAEVMYTKREKVKI